MKKSYILIFFAVISFGFVYSINFFTNSTFISPEIEIRPRQEKIYENVILYFRCPTNNILAKETRYIVRTVESRAAIILKELIKGPVDPKLQPILSPRTKIYSVLIVGDTVYVNFSIEFSADLPRREIDEVLAVYSVVNSLTEIDNINNVQVLIEGERSYAFLNHFSLREPLVRNEKLTKETIDLPIDVLRLYFKHLENQEIRQAFNLIYCPKEFELGYSTFFYETMKKIQNYKRIEINEFVISYETKGVILTIDYTVEQMSGETVLFENATYQFRNYSGEWKILRNSEL